MNLENFENKRWEKSSQNLVFRHEAAYKLIKKGEVLDLGCGDGLFRSELKKEGIKGQGLDISDTGVKKCREKGIKADVLNFSSNDLPFGNKRFEYAALLDVLEHVYEPEKLLKEAGRVANYVVLSVPNFSSLPARLQMILGKAPENMKPHKGHVYWFNFNILKKMLNNNFKIEKTIMNTFWEDKFIIGSILKLLTKKFPNIFALTFVVLVKTK